MNCVSLIYTIFIYKFVKVVLKIFIGNDTRESEQYEAHNIIVYSIYIPTLRSQNSKCTGSIYIADFCNII